MGKKLLVPRHHCFILEARLRSGKVSHMNTPLIWQAWCMHNTHRNVCLTHIKLVAKGGQRKKLLFANTLNIEIRVVHSSKNPTQIWNVNSFELDAKYFFKRLLKMLFCPAWPSDDDIYFLSKIHSNPQPGLLRCKKWCVQIVTQAYVCCQRHTLSSTILHESHHHHHFQIVWTSKMCLFVHHFLSNHTIHSFFFVSVYKLLWENWLEWS